MKNQYFGDRNDYFKYGLVLHLLKELPLNQFTFIAMLTPNDETGHGGKTEYPQVPRLEELHAYLQDSIRDEQGVVRTELRDVRKIGPFFDERRLGCHVYAHGFTHATRNGYFAAIPDEQLKRAVILLDPDNGLEVKSMAPGNGHKFVRYAEVHSVYERMDDESVLVIYQHLPMVQRCKFYADLRRKLAATLGSAACRCVSDNVVSFIALAKTELRGQQVEDAIEQYAADVRKAHLVHCLSM